MTNSELLRGIGKLKESVDTGAMSEEQAIGALVDVIALFLVTRMKRDLKTRRDNASKEGTSTPHHLQ